jgi:hypothetical protein
LKAFKVVVAVDNSRANQLSQMGDPCKVELVHLRLLVELQGTDDLSINNSADDDVFVQIKV